jgi:hypothetical protein
MLSAPNSAWTGWISGGEPDLSSSSVLDDFLYWMDWPGFTAGTSNTPAVISGAVPQSSTGTDSQGITNTAYKFETLEIPSGSFVANDVVQLVFIVPHYLINNSTQIYGSIGYDFSSTPNGVLNNFTTTNNYRAYDVTYTGNVWEQTTYRVFSNIGSLQHTVPSGGQVDDYYFRGGALI